MLVDVDAVLAYQSREDVARYQLFEPRARPDVVAWVERNGPARRLEHDGDHLQPVLERLADGRVIEERQPHMRGGAHEPLTRTDIAEKFVLNARHGGWDDARARSALALLRRLYDGKIDLQPLRG